MAIVMSRPGVDGLSEAVGVLRQWQYDGAPMRLHPGDLGWFWRSGAEAAAAAVRTWSRDGRILAVGLLDEPELLRLTIAPNARRDEELARQLVEDVTGPERGVLMEGKVYVDAPAGALVQDLLVEDGWKTAEPWTPLRHDLAEPVGDPGVRIEVIKCGRRRHLQVSRLPAIPRDPGPIPGRLGPVVDACGDVTGHGLIEPRFALGHECVAGDALTGAAPGDLVVVPWAINCGTCRAGLAAHCSAVPPMALYGAPFGGDRGGLFADLGFGGQDPTRGGSERWRRLLSRLR
ncbi:alcohol dehydrogenase catalytic domain-containing protein [Streptomyces sp. NPDC005356]|uniref:alcohol dehydrogenase catalytic domain-containing protein n=1 Tax=Streptomyces sp. NPDC005356 TaxID=3157167 RepID=UPI0033BFAE74